MVCLRLYCEAAGDSSKFDRLSQFGLPVAAEAYSAAAAAAAAKVAW